MRVRPAEAGDVAAVRQLVRAAYSSYVDAIGREPAPMAADHGSLIAAGVVDVAEDAVEQTSVDTTGADGASIVGVIVMWPEADHWYVDNVAVAPARQGSGVGSRLLDHAEDAARAAGLGEIRLYTNVAMTANLAWYPDRGFVERYRATDAGFERAYFTRRID